SDRATVPAKSDVKLPKNIRVGLDCLDWRNCKRVQVLDLEDYTKRVLPLEWKASWNIEALKAGSVAARTYGAYFALHPRTKNYDICDTPQCQVFDPDSSQQSTDLAVDATAGKVLTDKNREIAMTEFSSENNDAGCGDGQAGNGTSASPCIEDEVCTGA